MVVLTLIFWLGSEQTAAANDAAPGEHGTPSEPPAVDDAAADGPAVDDGYP